VNAPPPLALGAAMVVLKDCVPVFNPTSVILMTNE